MLNSKKLYVYLIFVVFVFIVSFVLRYRVLFGQYVLDDFVLIVYNRFITDINNIFLLLNPVNIVEVLPIRCGARPVAIATLVIDFWICSKNPFWYHFVNLLLHSINSCLVFLFCYLLKKDSMLFPVSSALFFSLHPIQTEVISVISFRADLLLVFFSLLSLNVLNFLDIHSTKIKVGKKLIFLFAFVFVCFSFFSKENTVVLPIVIFLYLLFFYRKIKYFKYSFYIFFCICFLFLFFWIERFPVPLFFSIYPNILHNVNPLFNFTNYIYTIINSLFHNVVHILYPVNLSVDYTLTFSKNIFLVTLIFITSFIISIKLIKDKYIRFSMLIIITMYLPVSNIVPLVNTIADRYMYYPMIAISILFGLLVVKLQKFVRSKIIIILLFLLFIINSFISYTRCKVYSSQYLLYSDAITKYPTNIRVLYNMAVAYFDNNEFEKSIETMNKLIEINPIYNRDKVWYIQALSYEKLNDKNNAIKYCQKSFLLNPDNQNVTENLVRYFGNIEKTLDYVCKSTTKISNRHLRAIQNVLPN